MTTWTVTGLVDDEAGELYVAAVFEGQVRNADRNAGIQAGGRVLERFTGYFEAGSPDQAEEMAREIIRYPYEEVTREPVTRRPHRRTVKTATLKGDML